MNKNIKNKTINIWISIIILVIIFFMYVRYYYGKINLAYILTHFIVCFNIILNIIKDLYIKIIENLFTNDNIKIILIGIIIIYITRDIELKKFLKDFLKYVNKLQSPWFSIERQLEAMDNISNNEKENIEKLSSISPKENTTNEDIERKIELSKKKMDLIRKITSDRKLLEILNCFINKKNFKKKIPINVFKTYDIDVIKSIFEITTEDGYVVLNKVKDDIKELVNEIYLDICTRY